MIVNLRFIQEDIIPNVVDAFGAEIKDTLSNLEELQNTYKQLFNIDTYDNLDDSEVKDFVINYDIENIKKWFAVKIYDRTKSNEIDPFSKERFKKTELALKQAPHIVRGYFHIIGPQGDVEEHVDTEYGFNTEDIPVYNYIVGISIKDDNVGIQLVDQEISPFVQGHHLLFDAKHPHSAYNRGNDYAVILVLHIERSAFV